MARMITNYEKHKERIITFMKDNPTSSPGCIYRELTGEGCKDYKCYECTDLLAEFLLAETERTLSEKEIMFCRIAGDGFIERRPSGILIFLKDRDGSGYLTSYDSSFLDIFKWLEVSDEAFDVESWLKSYE